MSELSELTIIVSVWGGLNLIAILSAWLYLTDKISDIERKHKE